MDRIADTLTIIRNGLMVKKESVKTPCLKVVVGIGEVLKKEGWIKDFAVKEKNNKSFIIFTLKYSEDGSPAISQIKKVSKPGKRVYVSYREIPKVRSGYGTAILSTPKGILTGKQAKQEKAGGELLCVVY